jgi:flagellar motor switch protein FliG
MNDDGVLNSAILLMTLGEDEAAEVLRYLAPREVEKLGSAMAGLADVSRQKIEQVLEQFHQQARGKSTLGMASDEYIRAVLTKALGNDKASVLLERILQSGDTKGIDSLKWMEASAVAELVANEHPQIVATILVHLDRDHASEILAHLDEALRSDIVYRIATLDGVQPAALRELNEVLMKLLSGTQNARKSARGGVRTAAEILNFMSGACENAILDIMREQDSALAQMILDEMFVFENLLEVDDRGIQVLLREIESESLIVALKGATEELREKIFRNMSQRAAEMLREDLEAKGPVRVSEVEAQQREILKTVKRLADAGLIAIAGKGENAYV